MGAGSQLHVALGDNGALEGFGKRANKLAESKLPPVFKNDMRFMVKLKTYLWTFSRKCVG